MIVNLPISIDAEAIEDRINKELEKKVDLYIKELVITALKERDPYHGMKTSRGGILDVTRDRIDDLINENKEEIVNEVARKIVDRMRYWKKIKEAIEEGKEAELDG